MASPVPAHHTQAEAHHASHKPEATSVKIASKSKKSPASLPSLSLTDMNQRYEQWSLNAKNSEKNIQGDETAMRSTLRNLRGFDPKQLGQGWIAHMALAASTQEEFINAVKTTASANPSLAQDLLKDPRKVTTISGIEKSFFTTLDQVSTDDQAYRWLSQSYEANARGKDLPTKDSVAKVSVPMNIGLTPYRSTNASKEPSVMEKTMALAAVKVLDKDKEVTLKPLVDSLAQHKAVTSCLSLAQQNVDQCQAAAKGKTDLSFCVAKHNLAETAQCFAWILP
jgi:hypothetical protein